MGKLTSAFFRFFLLFIFSYLLFLPPAWATTEVINYTYDNTYQLTEASSNSAGTSDYIYDLMGNALINTATSVGATNNPPTLTYISPANGATGVNMRQQPINWQGSDPDTGDIITYYLYYGTSPTNMPLVWSGTGTSYTPISYQYNQPYYWKIVAKDNHNAQTVGSTYSFTAMADTGAPISSNACS
jgi:hypothetical protein